MARLETWRSYRLGHDGRRPISAYRTFMWVVRGIVLANLVGFAIWILYIYYSFD
jgi:hypothetical protein